MAFDKGYALLVGVGKYQNPNLAAEVTAVDAQGLAAVLQNPQAAGYPSGQVTLLVNEQASRAGILGALQTLATQATPDGTVVIFLCGHGMPTPDQKSYYFLPYDTQATVFGGIDPKSIIASDELVQAIGAVQAQKVVIIFNTCFSGLVAGALDAPQTPTAPPPAEVVNQVLSVGQGRVVLSACKPDQKSWYNAGAGHTLFVQHLLDGLSGTANISNGRGYIGLFELYEYVYDKVHTGIKQIKADADQDPVITIHSGVGPFPLALYAGGQTTAGNLDPGGLKSEPISGAVEIRPAIQAGHDVIQAGRDVNQATQGGVVNTGQMGNVQTGSGTQWNIGSVSSGRDTNIGSTINEQQYGGIRTGDNAQFGGIRSGDDAQFGGTRFGANTQFSGPVNTGERGVAVGGNISGSSLVTGDDNGLRQQWGDTVGGDKTTVGDVSGTGIAIGRQAQAHGAGTPTADLPLDVQTIAQIKDLLDQLTAAATTAIVNRTLPVSTSTAILNDADAAKQEADTPSARQALTVRLQKIAGTLTAGGGISDAARPLYAIVRTIGTLIGLSLP